MFEIPNLEYQGQLIFENIRQVYNFYLFPNAHQKISETIGNVVKYI